MEPISLFEMRRELRRVLQSKHFAKAPKRSRFLEFVCEQTFQGDANKLNEYLVGTEVYGRGPDFNASEDPIVRVQAHEIRRALKHYYEEEGRDSNLRIDLPAGHYVPVFTRVERSESPSPDRSAPPSDSSAFTRRDARQRTLIFALGAVSLLMLALLVREHLANRPAAAALPAEMTWFWEPFLPPASPPLIAVPVHPLLRAAHEEDPPEVVRRGHLVRKEDLPEFRETIHYRELEEFRFLPTLTDFTSVGETLGLIHLVDLFAAAHQRVRLKASRLVDFEEIGSGNAILLGGNQPWSGRVFLYPQGFHFHKGVIWNSRPREGEQAAYRPDFDPLTHHLRRDYALLLMLPNTKKDERILLLYGIYTQGSQAAIEFVTNPERLVELRLRLLKESADGRTPPKFFQALLETPVENYVPGRASLVAVRRIPE